MAVIRAALLCVMLLCTASTAGAHPMHNTISELTEDRSRGTVRAVIRVFADDFGTVTRRGALGAMDRNLAALSYIATTFIIADRTGRTLPLRSCGTREASGVVWVCVETDSREGLAALQVRATVLCDLYDDQVNLVQATVSGGRKSLLFTRGAKARPLG